MPELWTTYRPTALPPEVGCGAGRGRRPAGPPGLGDVELGAARRGSVQGGRSCI